MRGAISTTDRVRDAMSTTYLSPCHLVLGPWCAWSLTLCRQTEIPVVSCRGGLKASSGENGLASPCPLFVGESAVIAIIAVTLLVLPADLFTLCSLASLLASSFSFPLS